MRIINQSAKLMAIDADIIHQIASAARVCYKSEGNSSTAKDIALVKRLIENGHTAMLEHGTIIFTCSPQDYAHILTVARSCEAQKGTYGMPSRIKVLSSRASETYVITNARDIMNLVNFIRESYDVTSTEPFTVQELITGTWTQSIDEAINDDEDISYGGKSYIEWCPMGELPVSMVGRQNFRHTAIFTVDRAIANEFVRHRDFSFAQESTRYCDYKGDIAFIDQNFEKPCQQAEWAESMECAEMSYRHMRDNGASAQMARSVLPMSTATTLVMTGDKGDWKRFFDLRLRELYGVPHPLAKSAAGLLYSQFVDMFGEGCV